MFIIDTLIDWYTVVAEFLAAHIWVMWVLLVWRCLMTAAAIFNAVASPWGSDRRALRSDAINRSCGVIGAGLVLYLLTQNPAWAVTFWLAVTASAFAVLAGFGLYLAISEIDDRLHQRRRATRATVH